MSQDLLVGANPAATFQDATAADVPASPSSNGRLPWPFPAPFADADGAVSAFFYPPSALRQRDTVVVLCNPIGWEAIAATQSFRELATRLANVGFPVLRFDYRGTGDSSGTDDEPDRVLVWLRSVHGAVEHARRCSGRHSVALVGLHLGATLAMCAALEAGGVDSLTLWAPYAKGRTFAREAKAYYSLAAAEQASPRLDDGSLEVAGFLLTAATLKDLSALDLTAAPQSPAPKALVIGRDSTGAELPLVKHLRALGSEVEHDVAKGYANMMRDPRGSVIPSADCDRIVSFLNAAHPASGVAKPTPIASDWHGARYTVESDPRTGPTLHETTLALGPDKRLFGVLTQLDTPPSAPAAKPAVIFLNTTPHTRIGPNRMYVPLARALAKQGFPALRFDLSGVGDSPRSTQTADLIYSKEFVKDVTAAMDGLQELGFARFVIVGLCSGAYLAFHTALSDPRVVSAVMINPQTFDWKDGDSLEIRQRSSVMSTSFYQRALLNPETWRRALKGDIDFRTIALAFAGRAQHRAKLESQRLLTRLGLVERERWVDVGASFDALVKRGTSTYMVYSGDDEGIDHLASQVGSRLRRLRRHRNFRMDIVPGPDHTFSQLWAQARLQSMILSYLADRFA